MWDRLEPIWRSLLDRAGTSSAFLSVRWTRAWMSIFGSVVRPTALLWLDEDREVVGAALLSSQRARIGPFPVTRTFLNTSGKGPVPEHNNLLAAPEAREEVLDDFVAVVLRARSDELALVGVTASSVEDLVSRWPVPAYEGYLGEAPYVDLNRLRSQGLEYLSSLSSNTRSQVRRSIRRYEERLGPPVFEVAETLEQRRAWLSDLVALHEQRWARVGQAGAFAEDDTRRFHEVLLADCSTAEGPDQLRVDIVRLRFGDTAIGYLYTLDYRGKISFFQSGLRYDDDGRLKPGLVTHVFAVEHYLSRGATEYDFLGGEPEGVQYKRSLSTDARTLAWVQLPAPTAKMRLIRALRHLRRRALARTSPAQEDVQTTSPTVRELSFDAFESMEERWERLREDSGADPLFMGWTWLSTWWKVFGRSAGAEWVCPVVEDRQGRLRGGAALYLHRSARRGAIRPMTLDTVGGFVRPGEGVLGQYAQLLGDSEQAPSLVPAMLDHLARGFRWSELSLGLVSKRGPMLDALRRAARARRWYVRERDSVPSHIIEIHGTFAEYCASLAPSVRRRLKNERKRLEALGDVALEYVPVERADEALELMNHLRRTRSGEPAFSGSALDFHKQLVADLSHPGSLRLTTLSIAGEPVSVNYALRLASREYGIAMGFDQRLDNKVSLGTLHLGYALEDAWRDGVLSYDLMTSLPGADGWKQRLANTGVELVRVQVVRHPVLAALYRWRDRRPTHRSTPSAAT